LSSQSATPTDTGGRWTTIHPLTIGARCAQLADIYAQYKINTLRVSFKPGSVVTNAATANTAVQATNPAASNLAGGFVLDPTTGVLAPDEILEAGGQLFRTGYQKVFILRNTKWLYTDLVGSSTADVRFVSPGNFYLTSFITQGAGTGGTAVGYLEFDWDVSFRYAIDAASEIERQLHPYSPLDELRRLKALRDEAKHETKSDDDVLVCTNSPSDPILTPATTVTIPSFLFSSSSAKGNKIGKRL